MVVIKLERQEVRRNSAPELNSSIMGSADEGVIHFFVVHSGTKPNKSSKYGLVSYKNCQYSFILLHFKCLQKFLIVFLWQESLK